MTSLIGVVHLLPLPGGPVESVGIEEVVRRARSDAWAMATGGVDALIVENFGDAPFHQDRVGPSTVAMMTRAVAEVRQEVGRLPVGVNVLRNDAVAAMAVAVATGASFIRVNVYVGATVTDQGVIQGAARAALMARRRLGAQVKVAADVMVKHGTPLGSASLEEVARDAWHRGRADRLIVTGAGTGAPTCAEDVGRVRAAVPAASVWVGSGVNPDNADEFKEADGCIVGTFLHAGSDTSAPVEEGRVREMVAALR